MHMDQDERQGSAQGIASSEMRTATSNAKAHSQKQGVSRRTLLKGAAVIGAGATVATAGGISLASQNVTTHAASAQAAAGGQVREYWIQADSFFHNLVPSGYDGLMGMHYTPNQTSYWAIGYRAYTPNWGQPLPGNSDIGANTGIPGPILRGSVGDTIRVHFRNNDVHHKAAHSMHPHGVSYTPDNDGGWYAANPRPGTVIQFGQTYTYNWQVKTNSVGTWVYHDHSLPYGPGMAMEFGAELGLFGFLVLSDASTTLVDVENFVFFHDLYQADVKALIQDFDCFNGFSYVGNTPTFTAKVGNRVRWHIGALGVEFHVFHLHGHRWLNNGQYVDTMHLGPSMATSFDYVEDNPGQWLYHCHVNDHMMGGMSGLYVVNP